MPFPIRARKRPTLVLSLLAQPGLESVIRGGLVYYTSIVITPYTPIMITPYTSIMLTLLYSEAEYCAPVWCCSAHTHLIDNVLNNAMLIVTGCLRPTSTDYNQL